MSKQLSYKDNFDMLLFRHDYLKKVKKYDPTWLKDFDPIIKTTASKMFKKYEVNMDKVGLEISDAIQLTQLFTIYYMSLYSIYRTDESYAKYEAKFEKWHDRKPNKHEQKISNRNQLINFIRQRFKRVDLVCIQKSRNIICGSGVNVAYAKTKDSVPSCSDEILLDHKKFGYRKITISELKEAKVQAKNNSSHLLYDKFGFQIKEIRRSAVNIRQKDYESLFVNSRGTLNNSPEVYFENIEEDKTIESYRYEFRNMKESRRETVLNNFIEKNKKNSRLKEEVKAARSILNGIKSVVS